MRINNMLILIMAICILLNSTICVSASENNLDLPENDIQEIMLRILASAEFEKENYGLNDVDFSSVKIGERIPVYEVNNGQLTEGNIKIFPLYSDEIMVSQFFVTWRNDCNEWYVQLDNTLIEKTLSFVKNNQFVYIYDNDGVYVCSEGKINLVGLSENNDKYTKFSLDENEIEIQSEYDRGFQGNYINSISENSLNSIKCDRTDKAIILNVTDYLEKQPSTLAELPAAYLNVPIIKQPKDTQICWAIAVTSIINYIYGYNYSYKQIVNMFYDGVDKGRPIKAVINKMNEYFNTNYAVGGGKPGAKKILSKLQAGYPIYGSFSNPEGSHAVVIRGCNKLTKSFSVMNPTRDANSYTMGNYTKDKVWTFTSATSGKLYTLKNHGFRN